MGLGLYEAFAEARLVIDTAHGALKEELDLKGLLFEGSREELALTSNTQPAVLTVSLAAHAAFQARAFGVRPTLVAGHSLGEYSALVAAGSMALADAVRIVRTRGVLMQRAVPQGVGAMAAVIGVGPEQVKEACRETAEEVRTEVCPANLNSPGQTVISGEARAVELACRRLKKLGARRTLPLRVSAPFHSGLMNPVKPLLEEALGKVELRRPSPPLVSNVEAVPVDDPERIRMLLVEQVTSPVRWVEVVGALVAAGVTDVVELGCGRVLCGLVRGVDDSIECHHVGSPEEIEEVADLLQGGAAPIAVAR